MNKKIILGLIAVIILVFTTKQLMQDTDESKSTAENLFYLSQDCKNWQKVDNKTYLAQQKGYGKFVSPVSESQMIVLMDKPIHYSIDITDNKETYPVVISGQWDELTWSLSNTHLTLIRTAHVDEVTKYETCIENAKSDCTDDSIDCATHSEEEFQKCGENPAMTDFWSTSFTSCSPSANLENCKSNIELFEKEIDCHLYKEVCKAKADPENFMKAKKLTKEDLDFLFNSCKESLRSDFTAQRLLKECDHSIEKVMSEDADQYCKILKNFITSWRKAGLIAD